MGDTRGWILLTTTALVLAAGVTWVDTGAKGPRIASPEVSPTEQAPLMRTAVRDVHVKPNRAEPRPRATRAPTVEARPARPKPPALRIAAPILARELVDPRILVRQSRLDPGQIEWLDRDDEAALRQVLHGQCQLAIVTGRPEQRPETPGLEFAPLGDFVLAFLRHPTLSVRELRPTQIHRILTGNYDSWRRVGGRDEPIETPNGYLALTSDSRELLPSSKSPVGCDVPDVRFVQSTPGAFAAIDLATLSCARQELFVEPMLLEVAGVAPTLDAFRQGRYRPGRRLWIAWRKDAFGKVRTLVQRLTAPVTLKKFAPRLMPVGPVSLR